MAREMAQLHKPARTLKRGGLATLTASLMLGGCAQTADLLGPPSMNVAEAPAAAAENGSPASELQKATAYWGQEFAKTPADLKAALSYARNLKALGEKQKAMSVLQQAAVYHDGDPELAGEYGRLALEFDQLGTAAKLLEVADNPAKPDWKIISARGTVLAKQGEYKQAIPFYERALALSQNQPSVLNNLAMAHAMSGDAKKAEEILRQAAGQQGSNPKVHQNLALVLGLQGRYDEAKSEGGKALASDSAAANTDYIRKMVRLDPAKTPAVKPAAAVATAQPVAEPAAFKTVVSKSTPVASAAKAIATPPAAVATALKPASADLPLDPVTGWDSKVAAAAPKPAAPAPANPLFKGSSN